jgi:hypothetical protein
MRKYTKLLTCTVVLAAAGWFAGCNSTIDNEPNVVLEVQTMTIPPVTTSTQDGVCTFTITNATTTFNNKPKNSLSGTSTAPFNDIVLQNVVVSYVWDDLATTPAVSYGLSGTIPAGGSNSTQFSVANNLVLSSGATPRDGHTANLALTFYATTVAGDAVSVATGGQLTVNSCTAESFGACCTGVSSGACSDLSQTDCIQLGGAAVFQGNNTQCVTTVCP